MRLRDVVSHLHDYEPGKPELVWLAETICGPPIVHRKGKISVVHNFGKVKLQLSLIWTRL